MTTANKICASPQACMDAFLQNIESAGKGGFNAELALRDSLFCLLGLHINLLETDAADVDPKTLNAFREKSLTELLKFRNDVNAYADITFFMAESANVNLWYPLCMRRSVLQVLLDDYTNTPVAELIAPQDVDDLDQELRKLGVEQGPVPESNIPWKIPDSHWWWRYPSGNNSEDQNQQED